MKRTAVLLAFAIGCGVATAATEDRVWTRSEILEIADREARRLGYEPEQKTVHIFKDSGWWEYVTAIKLQDYDYEAIKPELEHQALWAIRYDDLNEPTLGGPMWIFIDRQTGQIVKALPASQVQVEERDRMMRKEHR